MGKNYRRDPQGKWEKKRTFYSRAKVSIRSQKVSLGEGIYHRLSENACKCASKASKLSAIAQKA